MIVRRALTLVTIVSLLSIAAVPAYGAPTTVRSSFKRAGTAAGVVTNGRYAGCSASSPCTEEPGPAGSHWYVVNAFSPRCHCAGTYIVNRQTAQTADPMQGPVDLNSPGLHRTLGSPLDQSNHADILIFGDDYGFSGSGVAEQVGEYAYDFQNSGASLGGSRSIPSSHTATTCCAPTRRSDDDCRPNTSPAIETPSSSTAGGTRGSTACSCPACAASRFGCRPRFTRIPAPRSCSATTRCGRSRAATKSGRHRHPK